MVVEKCRTVSGEEAVLFELTERFKSQQVIIIIICVKCQIARVIEMCQRGYGCDFILSEHLYAWNQSC